MNTNDFINLYWKNYILIEKEFKDTVKYVTLSEDNFSTYSSEYQKIILQIGSEIDVVLKDFCKYLDNNFNKEKMDEYIKCICSNYQNILQQDVIVIHMNKKIKPWYNMLNNNEIPWWKAYNKIKHERNLVNTINGVSKTSYKFANLENTLMALAGLYQILLNYYLQISKTENRKVLIPLPGSRLFKLSGNEWNDVNFVFDHAFYLEGSCLYLESSDIEY